ncbi:hypothetical protein IU436_27475 [Nocardia farcinica]|uniref:hypothetical protein n=1 Tax=Nocardia TaxID=1817 RepID=UPI00189526CF|nr:MULTISPECIES: hypothetical protein [Nocardia]MBF6215647.1 hypothetical protein [Nocardia puris]MBF6422382.1 hypothetical protein [Nocardia farcinica]MBF6434083.1 hypothetical protein [Nocardia farcinica]MBF6505139.1 hypothetical protein [Nocardia farcinica]
MSRKALTIVYCNDIRRPDGRIGRMIKGDTPPARWNMPDNTAAILTEYPTR